MPDKQNLADQSKACLLRSRFWDVTQCSPLGGALHEIKDILRIYSNTNTKNKFHIVTLSYHKCTFFYDIVNMQNSTITCTNDRLVFENNHLKGKQVIISRIICHSWPCSEHAMKNTVYSLVWHNTLQLLINYILTCPSHTERFPKCTFIITQQTTH